MNYPSYTVHEEKQRAAARPHPRHAIAENALDAQYIEHHFFERLLPDPFGAARFDAVFVEAVEDALLAGFAGAFLVLFVGVFLALFVGALVLFADALVLFADALVLFAGALVLFADALVLFADALVLFAGALVLFADALVLFVGALMLFVGALVLFADALVLFVGAFLVLFAGAFCISYIPPHIPRPPCPWQTGAPCRSSPWAAKRRPSPHRAESHC